MAVSSTAMTMGVGSGMRFVFRCRFAQFQRRGNTSRTSLNLSVTLIAYGVLQSIRTAVPDLSVVQAIMTSVKSIYPRKRYDIGFVARAGGPIGAITDRDRHVTPSGDRS